MSFPSKVVMFHNYDSDYQRVHLIRIPLNHRKIPLNHYKIALNHYQITMLNYPEGKCKMDHVQLVQRGDFRTCRTNRAAQAIPAMWSPPNASWPINPIICTYIYLCILYIYIFIFIFIFIYTYISAINIHYKPPIPIIYSYIHREP